MGRLAQTLGVRQSTPAHSEPERETSTMITEIGALVAIIKGLTDIAKAGPDLFGKRKKEVGDAVANLKGRIGGLAAQLRETVVLLKTIPAWQSECEQIIYTPASSRDDEMLRAASNLDKLIVHSRYDSFSDAFYRTKFDELPGLGKPMAEFRDLLERLEEQLKFVRPTNDVRALKQEWDPLMLRLRDLFGKSEELRRLANELHGQLISELEAAGK